MSAGQSFIPNIQNDSGQIKANYTGLQIQGVSNGVLQYFDIASASVSLSSNPTTTYPKSAVNKSYLDLFNASLNPSPGTVVGRLKENPIPGQVNLWRFQGSYDNKGSGNTGELSVQLRNTVSGFIYAMPIGLPSGKNSGVFNTIAISIADGASLPDPNGYALAAQTSFNDGNMIVEINSITRINNAFELQQFYAV